VPCTGQEVLVTQASAQRNDKLVAGTACEHVYSQPCIHKSHPHTSPHKSHLEHTHNSHPQTHNTFTSQLKHTHKSHRQTHMFTSHTLTHHNHDHNTFTSKIHSQFTPSHNTQLTVYEYKWRSVSFWVEHLGTLLQGF